MKIDSIFIQALHSANGHLKMEAAKHSKVIGESLIRQTRERSSSASAMKQKCRCPCNRTTERPKLDCVINRSWQEFLGRVRHSVGNQE